MISNVIFQVPNETQEHWFCPSSSLTYSIHTGYCWSPEENFGFAAVSSSKPHMAQHTFAALQPMLEWIKEKGFKYVIFCSDSPVSQYRNGKIVFLTRKFAMENDLTVEWLYTEAGHGDDNDNNSLQVSNYFCRKVSL